jgi:hypothetical protein
MEEARLRKKERNGAFKCISHIVGTSAKFVFLKIHKNRRHHRQM